MAGTVTVEIKRDDAQALANLAREYATASAHECLWDRIAAALDPALRRSAG